MAGSSSHSLKVLHLLKTSVGATWALRQMRELAQLGVEVHVALPAGGALVAQYEAAGIQVHLLQCDFPTQQLWQLPNRLQQLRVLVTEIQPHVIHSHFVGTTLVMRLALGSQFPIPRLFQVPGPLHLEHPLLLQAELQTANAWDYWVGSCRWTCDRYRDAGIAAKRVFLSYYGTDLAQFQTRSTGALRAELGLPATTPIVGMVAYMYAPKRLLGQTRGLKGHEDWMDAIALCLQQRPDIQGVLVGGAWNRATAYEQRLREYAKSCCGDRITFLGTRSDVAALYPDMDVAVHPSHSENVGGAVESLLLGIPTIATQIGGFPDLVKPGETGWLVPPKQPTQLAETMLAVLENSTSAHAIAQAGKQLAQQLFNVKTTAFDIFKIYHQVCYDNAIDSPTQAFTSAPETLAEH